MSAAAARVELEANLTMNYVIGLSCMAVFTLLCSGCSPLAVAVKDMDGVHDVQESLTKDQVRTAIIDGAQAAGWYPKAIGDGTIIATLQVRTHMVQVEIDYTATDYVTRYKSSSDMKIFCSEQDATLQRNMKISGRDECPGGQPLYIHKYYKAWTDKLNRSIAVALSPAYVGELPANNPGPISPSTKEYLCELANRDAARPAEEAAAMDAAHSECLSKPRRSHEVTECTVHVVGWEKVTCEDRSIPGPECPAGSGKDTAEQRIRKYCS